MIDIVNSIKEFAKKYNGINKRVCSKPLFRQF